MDVETSTSILLEMRTAEVEQLRKELADMRTYLDQYEVYMESLKSTIIELQGLVEQYRVDAGEWECSLCGEWYSDAFMYCNNKECPSRDDVCCQKMGTQDCDC